MCQLSTCLPRRSLVFQARVQCPRRTTLLLWGDGRSFNCLSLSKWFPLVEPPKKPASLRTPGPEPCVFQANLRFAELAGGRVRHLRAGGDASFGAAAHAGPASGIFGPWIFPVDLWPRCLAQSRDCRLEQSNSTWLKVEQRWTGGW